MDFLDINRLKDLLKIKKAEPENVEGEKTEIKEYYFVSRDSGRKLFYLSLSNRDKEKKEMIVSGKQIEYKNMVQSFKKDNLEVKIYPTREELGSAAGYEAANRIKTLQRTQPFVNIIFAAAPSQNEFLENLINQPHLVHRPKVIK